MANEQVESFVWLFEKFLEAMGGAKLAYIVIDQDPAMKIAIEKLFDTSIHRFCVWHITRRVTSQQGREFIILSILSQHVPVKCFS